MDTNTKSMYITNSEPVYILLNSVMVDIFMKKADDNTIRAANKIVELYPEIANENQWLRIVLGMSESGFERSPEMIEFIRKAMDEEFYENRKNVDFDKDVYLSGVEIHKDIFAVI